VKLLIMQFLQPPAISFLLHPYIFFSTLFLNTLRLFLYVTDQVSHPNITNVKIIFMYSNFCIFRQKT
jgi:hypothetical protein